MKMYTARLSWLLAGFCAFPMMTGAQERVRKAGQESPHGLISANAETADPELAELVVEADKKEGYRAAETRTATKTDTPLINVPQSVAVVTREQMDDQAMGSVEDVLRYIAGAGVAQGEGNRDTPVLRGNSMTGDFYIDGMRDDVQYYRDFYNVDRVEVLKGPNAMIFGRGGSGGIINRVTRKADGERHAQARGEAGSWGQYRGSFDFGDSVVDSFSWRLNGMYEQADSYRDFVELRRYGLNPTFEWRISDDTVLRFGYEFFHDERTADRGIPSFMGRPLPAARKTFFGSPRQNWVDATAHTFFAQLEHRLNDSLTLRQAVSYGNYDKFYRNVLPAGVNATGTMVNLAAYENATERDNFFSQTDLVWKFNTGWMAHELLAGMELGIQDTDNFRNTGYFDSVSPGATRITLPVGSVPWSIPYVSFRQSATDANNHGLARNAGFYVQDQIEFGPHFQAVAGLRYDHFRMDFRNNRTGGKIRTVDDLFSPRAGLIYKPLPEVSLYGSYSTSFVPRAGAQLASLTATNQAFEPEKFKNYEIGVKWDIRPDLALTAAAYQLDRSNVVAPDPADATKSILVDGQRVKGVELGLTGRVTDAWLVSAGYAYQDGEIRATQSPSAPSGNRIAQLPRHNFSLWNRYDFTPSFGVGLGMIYTDQIFASTDNQVSLPSFLRFDAALFYQISERYRVQLNVENLLGRHYYASAHNNNNITPGAPRALRLALTAEF